MTTISPYPLHWPDGVPRTPATKRDHPRNKEWTTAAAMGLLTAELRRLDARGIVVSSNVPIGARGQMLSVSGCLPDPGVAVYFTRRGTSYQLACDRWLSQNDNIWALSMHIEALRGMERWGVGTLEQAFAGYAALPAPGPGQQVATTAPPPRPDRPWWEVMGLFPAAGLDVIDVVYRTLAKSRHPDGGGTTEDFQELQQAYRQAKAEREG